MIDLINVNAPDVIILSPKISSKDEVVNTLQAMQIFFKLHYFKIILKSVLIPLNSYTDVLQCREERSTLFPNKIIYKNKEIVIIDRVQQSLTE